MGAKQVVETTEPLGEIKTWVVNIDAVSVATGRMIPNSDGKAEKAEVVRILRGGKIEAPKDHADIPYLLRTKSIVSEDEWAKKGLGTRRPLFRDIAAALGSTQDAGKQVKEQVGTLDAASRTLTEPTY